MTESEKLKMLQVMVGNDDTENILTAYLELAGGKILERLYPFDHEQTEVPEKYHTKQVEIAAYMLNKRGAEGQTAHTENGISRQYESGDVPKSLMRGIVPYCGVIK